MRLDDFLFICYSKEKEYKQLACGLGTNIFMSKRSLWQEKSFIGGVFDVLFVCYAYSKVISLTNIIFYVNFFLNLSLFAGIDFLIKKQCSNK